MQIPGDKIASVELEVIIAAGDISLRRAVSHIFLKIDSLEAVPSEISEHSGREIRRVCFLLPLFLFFFLFFFKKWIN